MKNKVKAGQQRRFRLIQEGLDRKSMGIGDVARTLGISYNLVHHTVRGHGNNRRVLRCLLELGIDPAVLDLPDDLLTKVN